MRLYENPWFQRTVSVAMAAAVYMLASKFPDYAKELAGAAALLLPNVFGKSQAS